MSHITQHLAAELLDCAHALADAARATILPHFRPVGGIAAENKVLGGVSTR